MTKLSIAAIEQLLQNRPQGIEENVILDELKNRGYEIESPSFSERLKSSFGTPDIQAQSQRAEQLSGKRGRFDVGDIADVAGPSLPFFGALLGGTGGTLAGGPVGTAVGGGIGASAGESLRRTVGQLIGKRRTATSVGETAGIIGTGIGTALLGKAGEKTLPVLGSILSSTIGKGKGLFSKIGSVISKGVLGERGVEALGQVSREPVETGAFQRSVTGLQNIVESTHTAISSLRENSKIIFKAAEEKLNNVPIQKNTVVRSVMDSARNFFGIEPGERINLTLTGLSDQERNIVNTIIQKVREFEKGAGTTNTSKKLLNLIRSLDSGRFYKGTDDFRASDAFFTSTRKVLKNILNEVDPAFGEATKKAAQDIEFLEQLGFNVVGNVGRSVEATGRKLSSLLTKIDTPLERKATIKLITELEQRTGVNILGQLKSLSAGEYLSRPAPGAISAPLMTIHRNFERLMAEVIRKSKATEQFFTKIKKPSLPLTTQQRVRSGAAEAGMEGLKKMFGL